MTRGGRGVGRRGQRGDAHGSPVVLHGEEATRAALSVSAAGAAALPNPPVGPWQQPPPPAGALIASTPAGDAGAPPLPGWPPCADRRWRANRARRSVCGCAAQRATPAAVQAPPGTAVADASVPSARPTASGRRRKKKGERREQRRGGRRASAGPQAARARPPTVVVGARGSRHAGEGSSAAADAAAAGAEPPLRCHRLRRRRRRRHGRGGPARRKRGQTPVDGRGRLRGRRECMPVAPCLVGT